MATKTATVRLVGREGRRGEDIVEATAALTLVFCEETLLVQMERIEYENIAEGFRPKNQHPNTGSGMVVDVHDSWLIILTL